MAELEAKVGRQSVADGTINPIRQNIYGSLVAEQGGKYAEAAAAGRLFSIANQAAVATTAALATTWTGLAIGNPTNSGMRMSVLQFGWGLSVAGAKAGAIGLMGGATSLTPSLTPAKRINSSSASSAVATAGQTIATPVLFDIFGDYGTVATSSVSTKGVHVVDLDGSLILEPGRFIATYTTLDTTAAFVFSFLWEEISD